MAGATEGWAASGLYRMLPGVGNTARTRMGRQLRIVACVLALGLSAAACSKCDVPSWQFWSCKDTRPAGQ
jgi:hypothetical protein